MGILIHIDGGSRGNPGPAACGIVIQDASHDLILHEAGYFIGEATNNVAEYQGLIKALQVALEMNLKQVHVISDSQLMVRQILGQYKVKADNLKPLHRQATELFAQFDNWRFEHVKRAHNQRADAVANLAMDAKRDIVAQSTAAPGTSTPVAPQASTSLTLSVVTPAPCCLRYAKEVAGESDNPAAIQTLTCPDCGAMFDIV